MMLLLRKLVPLLAFAVLPVALGAYAQDFPTKPIRLIVPDATGGSPDTLGRILAQKLSESLGQQVIVDNRPGAGGILAAEIAAKAQPDGYTLFMTTT
jgi:tripartite-type tricarboxylate transporter receptor subunit TctC